MDEELSEGEIPESLIDGKMPFAKDFGVHMPRIVQNHVSPFAKAELNRDLKQQADRPFKSFPKDEE